LQAHQSKLRGARLLLVEDNAVNQELARELLCRAGIVVTVAEDGAQALDILTRDSFDGVLMDCQMPVMDGYTATALVRRQEALRDLPVIAMTANTMVGDRDKALAAGMNDQIGKPIRIEEMFATLARWIRPGNRDDPDASPGTALESLGSFPGIDVSTWQKSGIGDAALYWRLLAMFLQGQEDFPEPFNAALAAGDLRTLRRLAHNVRSVAGTLGAHGVEAAAMGLESACAAGDDPTGLRPLLDELGVQLHPVIEGLRTWRASAGLLPS
jgi:CheY-like chemotaxis protein